MSPSLVAERFNVQHYSQTKQTFTPAVPTGFFCLPLLLYNIFSGLDLYRKSQGQRKAKPAGIIFAHSSTA